MADGIPEVVVTGNSGGPVSPFVQPDAITNPLSGFSTVNASTFGNVTGLSQAAPDLGVSGVGSASSSTGGALGGAMNFGLIGAGIGDLFGASGDSAEASDYQKASQIATQNEAIAAESTAIQKTQAQRDIYQTLGTQQAQVAGAGLSGGGSAQALLASSRSQGALTQQQLTVQGQLNVNAYKEQAEAYSGEAEAAKAAASASTAGGIGSILGGLF